MTRTFLVAPVAVALAVFVAGGEPMRGREVGLDRLVSTDPMPDGLLCEWYPSVALGPQGARAQDDDEGELPSPARGGAACTAAGCEEAASRQAVRVIQDPYAGFSAVRADSARNEVVLVDEFHHNTYVYDRLATTPPAAVRTEPKRVIGGRNTKSQFNSDAYVDPASGDIYVINNDSEVGLNVFSRQAQGNVKPDRELHTPYGGYGLAVDEARQELFVTVQHDGAVVTWPKNARGEDRPIRLLQGSRTRMADPHAVAFDPKTRQLFVANYGTSREAVPGSLGLGGTSAPRIPNWPAGNLWPFVSEGFRHEIVYGTGKFGLPSITVFAADAAGNTAPLRVIQGPKAQLNWPTGVAVDSGRGEVYVTNAAGDSVNVFRANASGDAAPIRVLKGERSRIKNPTGVFVDAANDEVWVANFGNHMATVYKRGASGDAAPIRVIRSAPLDAPTTLISNPYSIAVDVNRDQIIVPNCVAQPRIAMYDSLSDKNATAHRIIEGQKTLLNRTVHSVAYDQIHDEIIVNQNIGQAILTFRGEASGDEAPIRIIQGAKTLMRDPQVTFVDPVNNEIYVINMTIDDSILVFDRLAQGDVAPKRVLKGPDTMLGAEYGGVDPIHNLLVVVGRQESRGGSEGHILIFDRTASGNTEPLRVIRGPKSGLGRGGKMAIYPTTGKILVSTGGGVGVWSIDDNGDIPPEWRITTPGGGLAVDPKEQNVIVSNKPMNAILSYFLPEIF